MMSSYEDFDATSIASLDIVEDPLLETDLHGLDDEEFDIPHLNQLPSLDDVLSDLNEFSPFASPAKAKSMFPGHLGHVKSKESLSSFGSLESLQPTSKPVSAETSVLRHLKLKGISANILSARKRAAGYPSAICAGSCIAIGTSHGYILLFDAKQLLRFFLEPVEGAGAVSALSFNVDGSRLLSGHERGNVVMWDSNTGKSLRVINDMPGSAILHVKFTDDHTKALMGTGSGSVFLMSFKRPMGVRVCESKLIFSGSRGEVVALEPLVVADKVSNHALNFNNPMFIAMATFSKVFIIVLKPKLKIIFSFPLKGNVSTLPVISWQFIKLQVNKSSPCVLEPVILFGRDSKIVFAILESSEETARVRVLKNLNLGFSLTSLVWFNNKTVAIVDQKEKLHLLDIQSEENIDCLDLHHVGLVYATSAFKGLSNELGVSPAMNAASAFSCYYSILMSTGGQLLLLGQESLHVLVIRTWSERIEMYRKRKMYAEAISLSRQICEGTAKAVVGPLGQKKSLVISLARDVALEYSKYAVSNAPVQDDETLENYYWGFLPSFIDSCRVLKFQDFLFNDIYFIFQHDLIGRNVFLSVVESQIFNGNINKLSASLMKDLVNYNIESDRIPSIQDMILKLDISTIDFDQVMRLSWENGLFGAIIYLYNRAMNEYLIPLEELTNHLRKKKPEDRHLVNTVLVYLSCCMTGRDYTSGSIPDEMNKNVKIQALKFLLYDKPRDNLRFPNTKTLLLTDSREFLNVLSIAFEEPEFTTSEGTRVRQRIIDAIMLTVGASTSAFSPIDLGSIYIFLARQLMKFNLNLESEVFAQILEYLTSCDPDMRSTRAEREPVIMELLLMNILKVEDTNLEEKLVQARFYSVLEFMYEKRGQYNKLLRCYCENADRNRVIFKFVRSVLYQLEVSAEQKELLIKEVNNSLTLLIQVDPVKSAHLILVEMKIPIARVMSQLTVDHDSKMVYQFLSGVVELIAREKITFPDPDNVSSISAGDPSPSSSSSSSSPAANSELARDIVHKYMKLAAVLDIPAFEKFIRASSALLSIEDAMAVCSR